MTTRRHGRNDPRTAERRAQATERAASYAQLSLAERIAKARFGSREHTRLTAAKARQDVGRVDRVAKLRTDPAHVEAAA